MISVRSVCSYVVEGISLFSPHHVFCYYAYRTFHGFFVCVLGSLVSHAEMDEPVKMPFGGGGRLAWAS